MIYHKDWIMRQIEQMIDAITHLLLNTATTATVTETLELDLREAIEKQLRAGEICKTEDWIYENLNPENSDWLAAALYFYSQINEMSDSALEEYGFSREEIASGLRYVCEEYGLSALIAK